MDCICIGQRANLKFDFFDAGTDMELFSQGFLTIPGFSSCQEDGED
jgi:hypothetical protein